MEYRSTKERTVKERTVLVYLHRNQKRHYLLWGRRTNHRSRNESRSETRQEFRRRPAIPKVLATFATAKLDNYFSNGPK